MKDKVIIGRASLFLTTLIWGTSFVVLKQTLSSVPVLWVLAIRFIGAALIMSILSVKELKKLDLTHLKWGSLMGIMLFLSYIFQTYGLAGTTPGKNAFLTAVYCVIVPFLYWIVSRRRPDRYNIIAAVMCLTGVGFVSLNGDLSISSGDILTLIGGFFFALHIMATDKANAAGGNVMLLSLIQLAVVGILSLVSALIFSAVPGSIPSGAVWSIAYLCIFCTAICFFMQTFGQKHTPPSQAAVIMTFESVFGAMISTLTGQEDITARLILGFVLIFMAVIVSETKLTFLSQKHFKLYFLNMHHCTGTKKT